MSLHTNHAIFIMYFKNLLTQNCKLFILGMSEIKQSNGTKEEVFVWDKDSFLLIEKYVSGVNLKTETAREFASSGQIGFRREAVVYL